MNALLSKAKGRGKKQTPSGYTRIVGNEELGNLISKLHATVIAAGKELENLIWEYSKQIEDLDAYLNMDTYPTGIFLARKKQIKKSFIAQKEFEPDFIAFERTKANEHRCYVIEVKDGDQFDTKKSKGEKTYLHDYMNFIAEKIGVTATLILCSFNAIDKQQVIAGFKNKITEDEAYTGRELCDLLQINFDDIVKKRRNLDDPKENIKFFIKSLLEIEEVRELIKEELNHYVLPNT